VTATGAAGQASGPRAIPLLRCSAAGIPFGLCAEEVREFRSPEENTVGLAGLLGLADGHIWGDARTLELAAGPGRALIMVEGPVRIRPLAAHELLAMPRFLARAPLAPVIGFCEENGRVVLLLDVPQVARLAQAAGARDEEKP
jgi:hypothetical protein